MTKKLYCYVDETGQDTKGKFFLVALVLKDNESLLDLEKKLIGIENRSGKKLLKWKEINKKVKEVYLRELLQVKELKDSIFYSIYEETKEYFKLTSLTIAESVLSKEIEDYTVTIIIDGLNDKEMEIVRSELKKLRIRYRKIRGMKDEQSVFLRLSDAMAGFLREVYEGEKPSKQFIALFEKSGMISET